jgi:hypothetical protein
VTWATPAAISYGTTLSATLNAAAKSGSSTLPGEFAYTATPTGGAATAVSATTILGAGNYSLVANFIPTDSTDYATATASVTQVVNKTTPTINWAAPSAISYGTALGTAELNATAVGSGSYVNSPLAGSFAYSPVSGTVLGAGSQTLTATFTPTDTANYKTATATVTLTVNKATPTVTWVAPAAIVFGTALSPTQLDATASVPGTFVYNPASGAIPAVGNDTLSVTFTPTDSVNYATVTATVPLTVNSPQNPAPFLGSMTPAIADAGGAGFTITVNGAGFLASSTVY